MPRYQSVVVGERLWHDWSEDKPFWFYDFVLCYCLDRWSPTFVSAGASHQGNIFTMGFPCTAAMLCTSCCQAAHFLFNTCLNFSIWLPSGALGYSRWSGLRMRLTFLGYLPACRSVEAWLTLSNRVADSPLSGNPGWTRWLPWCFPTWIIL